MVKFQNLYKRFLFNLEKFIRLLRTGAFAPEPGQGLVEYALILLLVVIVILAIAILLGPDIANLWNNTQKGISKGLS